MKKLTLKHLIAIVIVAILVVASIVYISYSSNPAKRIEGHWVLSEVSKEDYSYRDYVSDEFYFFDNGKYNNGSWYGTYSINKNVITMTELFDAYNFTYTLKGNTLALKNVNNSEDDPYVYYERVDDLNK